MRMLMAVMLLSVSACMAQEPTVQPQAPVETRQPAQASQQAPPLVLPAGTRVPLALTNPIRRSTAHVGDAIRAVTIFPVTAGTEVAIPRGAYVEGEVAKVGKPGSTVLNGLQIHFTRLVFETGYAVALDGAIAQASVSEPGSSSPATGVPGSAGALNNALLQTPNPPPLPQVGPSKGPIIGAALGGVAAVAVIGILAAHHRANDRYFDTGWQFDMVLQAPLTLDADRLATTSDPGAAPAREDSPASALKDWL